MRDLELVYFASRPNAGTARDHIRHALAKTGNKVAWVEWDLEDVETPARYRSYASPTVLVGGRDVTDTDASVSAEGLSCSSGGAPDVDVIVRALQS